MKNLIVAIILIIGAIGFSGYAKDTVTLNGTEFVSTKQSNAGTKTKYTWKDSKGNVYPIYVSAKGKAYVIRKSSKTGKEYKYYQLPKEIKDKVESEYKK